MKQLLRAVSCAALLLLLSGCGSSGRTVSFTWFVDEIPTNLDPLMAQTSAELIACNHLYMGLYQLDETGTPQPGCASGHTLSADGRTYTFTLKPDLYYQDLRGEVTDHAITSEDFLFAFQRMFSPETNSPYAASFAGVRGGMEILSGKKPLSALGVYAPDPLTLVIQLNKPDPTFLEKLTLPGAMPCDELYFDSTKGTYGLTKKSTLTNGDFYLYNWTGDGLFLRKPANGDDMNNLRLVTNTNPTDMTPAQLVDGEKCTAALDLTTDKTDLQQQFYSNTIWTLQFAPDSVFTNPDLRKALAAAATDVPLPQDTLLYGPTEGIVPEGAVVDSQDYRQRADSAQFDLGDEQALWHQALTLTPIQKLKGLSLLVPDTADRAFVQGLNGIWQKRFGLFFNVETVDAETFAKRYADGDYTVALVPVELTIADPTAFLAAFETQLPIEIVAGYQAQSEQANHQTGGAKIDTLAQMEQLLVREAYVTPLFRQNARLLVDPTVSGLQFDPFGPLINVRWATRTE